MRRTRQPRFSVIRSWRTLVSLIYRGVERAALCLLLALSRYRAKSSQRPLLRDKRTLRMTRRMSAFEPSGHLGLVLRRRPRCKCSVPLRLAKHVRTAERCSSMRATSQSPEADSPSRSGTFATSPLSIAVDGRVTGQTPLPPVRSNALHPPAWKRIPRGWPEPRSFRCGPAWPCCVRDQD
jgi:hypothetical protein